VSSLRPFSGNGEPPQFPDAGFVRRLTALSADAALQALRDMAEAGRHDWLSAFLDAGFVEQQARYRGALTCKHSWQGQAYPCLTAIAWLAAQDVEGALRHDSREVRLLVDRWIDAALAQAPKERAGARSRSISEEEIHRRWTATAAVLLTVAVKFDCMMAARKVVDAFPDAIVTYLGDGFLRLAENMKPKILGMTPLAAVSLERRQPNLEGMLRLGADLSAPAALREAVGTADAVEQDLLSFVFDTSSIVSDSFPQVVERYREAGLTIPTSLWDAAAHEARLLAQYDDEIDDLIDIGLFDQQPREVIRVALSMAKPKLLERALPHYLSANAGEKGRHHTLLTELLDSGGGSMEPGISACVDLLVAAGVPIDGVPEGAETPLMLAARGGMIKVVRRLLDLGADTSRVDSFGDSALEYALRSGHSECIALLRAERMRRLCAGILVERGASATDSGRMPEFSSPSQAHADAAPRSGLRLVSGGRVSV
jgi:hypothetical protein